MHSTENAAQMTGFEPHGASTSETDHRSSRPSPAVQCKCGARHSVIEGRSISHDRTTVPDRVGFARAMPRLIAWLATFPSTRICCAEICGLTDKLELRQCATAMPFRRCSSKPATATEAARCQSARQRCLPREGRYEHAHLKFDRPRRGLIAHSQVNGQFLGRGLLYSLLSYLREDPVL